MALAASQPFDVLKWSHGASRRLTDEIAQETPILIKYGGVPHVVMLATPSDLEDYAVGFTLSEGYVDSVRDIVGVSVSEDPDSLEIDVTVRWERFAHILRARRNLSARSGCGLCGHEKLEDAVRPVPALTSRSQLTVDDLHSALAELQSLQPINARTGSVHAAAWVIPGAGIRAVREDVGRHNALDKTIGALARQGATFDSGFLLLTSRASFEMVQKAATVGIPTVVAISAPTTLAVRFAQACGMTLIGFARPHQHVIYAGAERLV